MRVFEWVKGRLCEQMAVASRMDAAMAAEVVAEAEHAAAVLFEQKTPRTVTRHSTLEHTVRAMSYGLLHDLAFTPDALLALRTAAEQRVVEWAVEHRGQFELSGQVDAVELQRWIVLHHRKPLAEYTVRDLRMLAAAKACRCRPSLWPPWRPLSSARRRRPGLPNRRRAPSVRTTC